MSPYLQVIVPSRGRPHAPLEVMQAIHATGDIASVRVTFAVDADDPALADYRQNIGATSLHPEMIEAAMFITAPDPDQHGRGMVGALNQVARAQSVRFFPPTAFMFMGDDHRPRSEGWAARYLEALAEVPIVYGNDLFQGQNLPTQFAIRADVVKALGFIFPPSLWHLYADNFILELGRRIGIRYLPEVEIEHMHPAAGKGQGDEHYDRVNAREVDDHDKAEFMAYLTDGRMDADAYRVLDATNVAGVEYS